MLLLSHRGCSRLVCSPAPSGRPPGLTRSTALVVFSLGCGFSAVVRSLLNAYVEAHHQAILNSLLALLQSVGLMIASPVFFEALRVGIDLGGGWIGLPFVLAAACGALATIFVFVFRLPREGI